MKCVHDFDVEMEMDADQHLHRISNVGPHSYLPHRAFGMGRLYAGIYL